MFRLYLCASPENTPVQSYIVTLLLQAPLYPPTPWRSINAAIIIIMPRLHRAEALSDDAHLTSDVCLSAAYTGSKSRTERPRKTKIGTEVADVTRDSAPLLRSKVQRSTCRGWGILRCPPPPAQLVINATIITATRRDCDSTAARARLSCDRFDARSGAASG